MSSANTIIITSINRPTEAIRVIAQNCSDWTFLVVGDKKTPADWAYPGVTFLSAAQQSTLGAFAAECPFNHYARKNVGYLWAASRGAVVIAETDDDNVPYETFLNAVDRNVLARPVLSSGWENIYTHFTKDRIWPRGFPLELVTSSLQKRTTLGEAKLYDCPIQQFLADGDPDVDAVYRMTTVAETQFEQNAVVLGAGSFCPFNSQNTVFFQDAFPLLYLPAFVSFRMTDIWRSFVAQICLYAAGKSLAFRGPTVFQSRNEHSLIQDFKEEIPGYLNNVRIIEILSGLSLSSDQAQMSSNVLKCYEALVDAALVPQAELRLLQLWLSELTVP